MRSLKNENSQEFTKTSLEFLKNSSGILILKESSRTFGAEKYAITNKDSNCLFPRQCSRILEKYVDQSILGQGIRQIQKNYTLLERYLYNLQPVKSLTVLTIIP